MSMKNTELEALRRLLFFSQAEAAELIGGCAHRTWQRWESGDRHIPDRIAEQIQELVAWRGRALDAARSEIARAAAEQGVMPRQIDLVWFASIDDWLDATGPAGEQRDALHWRPQQSVLAQLSSEYPSVKFI